MAKKLSYISTQTPKPYIYDNVIDVFLNQVEKYPDREIIIEHEIDGSRESLTYRELDTKASKLAQYLLHRGVNQGDRVALFGPNTLEWVIGELAIIMAGGIVVHVAINAVDAGDIWEIFASADCKAFLIDPGRGDKYFDCIFYLLSLFRRRRPSRDYQDIDGRNPTVVFLRKMEEISSFVDLNSIMTQTFTEKFPPLYPEDPILVFTTSGTTGKPKMVAHSHFDAMNIMLGQPSMDMSGRKVYNDRPFGWIGGTPILDLMTGQTRVFVDSSLGTTGNYTADIWNIIKTEKCTDAVLYPYFLTDLINTMGNYNDDFKLMITSTGGQIIDNDYTQVIGKFTHMLIVSYGSTEAAIVCVNGPIKAGDTIASGDVGRPLPGNEIKVVGKEGKVIPRNQEGEVLVRSRMLFQGYYKNPDATKQVFTDDHWFHTGDTGLITDDGRLHITGRIKEIISRGTRKIMPIAIEQVVLKMKHVAKVAVVAVPDKRLYEEVCVCFVSKTDSNVSLDDVKEFCNGSFCTESALDGLGNMPTYFLEFDNFPSLATGKTDRKKIREVAIERLGLNDITHL